MSSHSKAQADAKKEALESEQLWMRQEVRDHIHFAVVGTERVKRCKSDKRLMRWC
jgi:hypothetical protein